MACSSKYSTTENAASQALHDLNETFVSHIKATRKLWGNYEQALPVLMDGARTNTPVSLEAAALTVYTHLDATATNLASIDTFLAQATPGALYALARQSGMDQGVSDEDVRQGVESKLSTYRKSYDA
ncbi:hypothetical protein CC80DRAFT_544749 [Byssothecium circinans]|uniref:Uncharacterized protein n=1 Tax=Byssothecium circinans TaxID=147558 RepID=A0A6A5U8X8_9PLEO|nr:hypothetical protein CC80DRAFT_544749 [Byssothecium circinans]